jgi:hypothetical protein
MVDFPSSVVNLTPMFPGGPEFDGPRDETHKPPNVQPAPSRLSGPFDFGRDHDRDGSLSARGGPANLQGKSFMREERHALADARPCRP